MPSPITLTVSARVADLLVRATLSDCCSVAESLYLKLTAALSGSDELVEHADLVAKVHETHELTAVIQHLGTNPGAWPHGTEITADPNVLCGLVDLLTDDLTPEGVQTGADLRYRATLVDELLALRDTLTGEDDIGPEGTPLSGGWGQFDDHAITRLADLGRGLSHPIRAEILGYFLTQQPGASVRPGDVADWRGYPLKLAEFHLATLTDCHVLEPAGPGEHPVADRYRIAPQALPILDAARQAFGRRRTTDTPDDLDDDLEDNLDPGTGS